MYRFLPPIVGIVGFLVFVFGVFCSLYLIPLIEFKYFSQTELIRKGTPGFKQYFGRPKTLQFRVYLFGIRNMEEVVHRREKAVIREIGPYVYDVKKVRQLKHMDEEKGYIEFSETSYFSFNPTESKGLSEEDIITTVNVFLMGLEKIWKEITFLMSQKVFNDLVAIIPQLDKSFTRVKVKDLLFDGITISCVNSSVMVCDLLRKKNMQLLRTSGDNLKFSMFHHMNGTEMGPFVAYDGNERFKRGTLQKYKGKDMLDTWSTTGDCNVLKGTTAFIFPLPTSKIYKFLSDLCRSLSLDLAVHDDIQDVPTYTFVSTKEPFEASKENACYCKGERVLKTSLTCNIKGTMNLVNCKNFPVIVSYPHFYLGDITLQNYVEGLSPQKSLHGSFASIEATTGRELISNIRLQLSVKVQHFALTTNLGNLTEGIFPVLWFEDIHPLEPNLITYFLERVQFINGLRTVLVAIQELYLAQKVPKQSDEFSGRAISEKTELVTANVNLYPQLINRNVSDSFMKSVSD